MILLAPVVIKLTHPNLGEAYVAMIVTMPSMKNVFQNTIRSTFPFLKMNSSVTCYKVKPSESSRPSNEKWEEEESDYDKYEDDDDDIDKLFSLENKQKQNRRSIFLTLQHYEWLRIHIVDIFHNIAENM